MTDTIWEFHERQRKMSLTTRIFNNVLQSSGFSAEERLVREALQNSVDAHRPDADFPASIRMDKRLLTGADKRSLVEALDLGGQPSARRHLFDFPPGNALEKITEPNDPLPVLVVSDYHTCGLTGVWDGTGAGDHFGRLVVNLGVDDKAEGSEISGGSFGFGKTVYGKASALGIVAFYSVFRPDAGSEESYARFMATGLFEPHEYDGRQYDGFAFLGAPDPLSGHETVPVTDEAAHALAERCGIPMRTPTDYGTSILIVDCDPDVKALKEAAERYWWPRLIRQELDVVFDDEGEELIPRPRTNGDVSGFIAAWQTLDSRADSPPASKVYDFNRIGTTQGQLKPGTLSCAALGTEGRYANTVALVRGPGMVVQYRPLGSDSYQSCVGVFRSDPDVEKFLTYSEPQMHNEWDENSDRLKRRFGSDGAKVVSSILRRIQRSFVDFQKLQEPPVPSGGLRPKELSKLLGRFLDVPGDTPPPPPPPDPRPIGIHVHEDRVEHDGAVFDTADIELELKPADAEGESFVVSAYHEILGDASARVVERSICTLRNEDGELVAQGNPAAAKLILTGGRPTRLKAVAPSDEMFLTRIKVTVERAT